MKEKINKNKKTKYILIAIIIILIIAGLSIFLLKPNKLTQSSKDLALDSEEKELMAKDIEKLKNKQNIYGATVTGYSCTNNAGVNSWKIFYADNKNIYLIAENYIDYNNCPDSSTQKIEENNTEYRLSMDNVINDYEGTENIVDNDIKTLNGDYFSKNYTSTNKNMKAVAYMLDKNTWKVYSGDKAEYAIGGPTIELLFKSYNEKYETSYVTQATSETGYSIKKQEKDSWNDTIKNMLTKDPLYIINDTSNAEAMWLASPSYNHVYNVMSLNYNGDVGYKNYTSNDLGFRPVVCLKSDVQLQKTGDFTYQIN